MQDTTSDKKIHKDLRNKKGGLTRHVFLYTEKLPWVLIPAFNSRKQINYSERLLSANHLFAEHNSKRENHACKITNEQLIPEQFTSEQLTRNNLHKNNLLQNYNITE